MGIEVRRLTIELPVRVYNRLVWCQTEVGAGSMVEVIRHALLDYETKLKGRALATPDVENHTNGSR